MLSEMAKQSFFDVQTRNKVQSVMLLIFIFAVFMLLAWIVSLFFDKVYATTIFVFAGLFALFYIMVGYFTSDKIVLAAVKARKAEGYTREHNILEGLSLAAGLPTPKLYVMPAKHINAFATGRTHNNAVICLTEGAIEKLSRDEIEGVIAHELSHIKNYDMKFMTLVAVLVGAVAILARLFYRSFWFGDREKKGNIVVFIAALSFMIIAPIVTKLVQLAISRRREFLADATAVQLTRNPQGLIKALKKIKAENEKLIKYDMQQNIQHISALSPLFITSLNARDIKTKISRGLAALFSTHPPIDERIKLLEQM